MTNCKNCDTVINLNYCSNCGQPSRLKRIDSHYIVHEIQHVLHFEKGILFTVRELLISPGKNVRQYITENRSRLVKPIIFIIVTSLLYSLANHFFHVEDGYVNYGETNPSATGIIFKWVQSHYGYSNILMGVFIAIWTRLLFRNYNYNFFEILILLCFVMGMGMLLLAVFVIFQGLTDIVIMKIAGYMVILYCAWAIGQFFEKKKLFNYIKALGAYILGMVTFSLTIILVGMIIDLITCRNI